MLFPPEKLGGLVTNALKFPTTISNVFRPNEDTDTSSQLADILYYISSQAKGWIGKDKIEREMNNLIQEMARLIYETIARQQRILESNVDDIADILPQQIGMALSGLGILLVICMFCPKIRKGITGIMQYFYYGGFLHEDEEETPIQRLQFNFNKRGKSKRKSRGKSKRKSRGKLRRKSKRKSRGKSRGEIEKKIKEKIKGEIEKKIIK